MSMMPALRRCIGLRAPGRVGEANPVFGFTDAMSGIPERQAKLQLVKALLAHGANPNARMTQRPPGFAGGYTDAAGATPFLLAAATADIEMMRLLLAAGADPAADDEEQHDGADGGDGPESDARRKRGHGGSGARGRQVPAAAGR